MCVSGVNVSAEMHQALRRIYRHLRKKNESSLLLRRLIAHDDVMFFTFARRIYDLHAKLDEQLPRQHRWCGWGASGKSVLYKVRMSYLRQFYELRMRFHLSKATLSFLCAWALITMVYLDLLQAVHRGQQRQYEKTRQIASIINEMQKSGSAA